MKTENKLQVGQSIFIKPIGNAARRNSDIIATTITSVGKKYFTVSGLGFSRRRFFIDTLMHDGGEYTSDYKAYLSEQQLQDEREYKILIDKIRRHVGSYGSCNLTLNQCRGISQIIGFE